MLCKNRIADGIGANYHMFFNSVRGIVEVIQYAGLKPEDCRIICADNADNRKKLPEGFQIESTSTPVKTINFYTSTCFEGCDIYDEYGRTFIICDPYRPNTLIDIQTSMRQICGRIRKTKYEGVAIIWNNTRHEDTDSFEAYESRLLKDRMDAEQNVNAINSMTSDLRKQWIANLEHFKLPLISAEDDMVYVDKYMINLLLASYKDTHQNFVTQTDFDAELTKNGFNVVEDLRTNRDFVGLMSIETISFKDCCEQYAEIKSMQGIFVFHEDERLVRLRNLNPEACDAVDKLGIDEVRRMKFHRQNIHRQLVKESTLPQKVKIKRELDRRLNKFEAYTIPTIRKTLGEIYGDVGLGKTPKATDLSEFYRLRKTKKEGHDAYVIEGDAFIIQ